MTGRRGEGAGAWFWMILLLVGLPLGLIHFVGWPLPHREPTRAEWAQFVTDPLTRRTGVDLFAIALWLPWTVLLYAVLADLAARLRRAAHRVWRLRKRLPPLPTAGGLLGAAVVGTGTAVVSVVATAHPPVLAAAAPPAPDTPAPPVSPGQAAPDHDQAATTGGWVAVPGGGWVSRQTAAAVAASAAMVWRDRRRHYRPRPLAGVSRDDLDLAPLPAAVTAVSQQVQPPPEQPPDPSDPAADTLDLDASPASAGAVAVLGERVGQPLPLSALPSGGVGLVGPGAVDAARGILIAALLSAPGPAAHPTVVTTDAYLAVVLGTREVPEVPGLLVAGDLAEAIAAVEDVAVARTDGANSQADRQDGSRTVLLVASPTDPQVARQLRVLLKLSADKAVTGVLSGTWQPDATWHVGPDGVVDNAAESIVRLSVLSTAATSDLLGVYREAHTPRPAHRNIRGGREADGIEAVRPVRVPRQTPAAGVLSLAAVRAPLGGRVRLTVLGPPAVYRPGETEPVRWPRTAALPVLVFLALHPAGATSTELAAVLWPQLRTRSTTNRIYNIMTTVRSHLDDVAGGPTIVRDGGRYRLDSTRVEVDLWRLHDAVRAAAGTPDPSARATVLRRIVDAYTGELADGWPWPWLDPHREATRRHVLDAYTTLAADQPDPTAAADLLRAAAAVDPDNEQLRYDVASTRWPRTVDEAASGG